MLPCTDLPLRIVVAEVIHKQGLGGKCGVSGKVEAGALAVGARVLILPQGALVAVKDVQVKGVSCVVVTAGQAVDVGLETAPDDLEPGSVLCHPEFPVHLASCIQVCAFWQSLGGLAMV